MLLYVFSVLSILVFRLCSAEKLHLPVPTCKRDAAGYATCLKNAINEAWPLLVEGLPEFDFPPLDPFFYEHQESVFDSGDLHGEIKVTNVTFDGEKATRFKVVRPYFSDDAFRLEIILRTPKVYVQGICEAHGTLAGFRMGGKGYCNITMEDIRSTWDISGPVKDDTWIIEHFRITPTMKNMKIYVDNLFEGSREINDLAMIFMNEYWPQLYRVALPVVADYWDTYFSNFINRFFMKLSFSEVFP